MLKHELSQTEMNDTLYFSALARVAWCRDNDVKLEDDARVQICLKTAMTRMVNQAKRLSHVDLLDPEWELWKAVRAQDIVRTKELLLVWEPIEETLRARERDRRRELAIQGRRR